MLCRRLFHRELPVLPVWEAPRWTVTAGASTTADQGSLNMTSREDRRQFWREVWHVLFASLVFIAVSLISLGIVNLGLRNDANSTKEKPAEEAPR